MVVRDRAKITTPGVRVVRAEVTAGRPGVLEEAVAGADAVLSALGPRTRAHAGIATEATRNILAAMTATGVSRISVVSAGPIDGPNPETLPGCL